MKAAMDGQDAARRLRVARVPLDRLIGRPWLPRRHVVGARLVGAVADRLRAKRGTPRRCFPGAVRSSQRRASPCMGLVPAVRSRARCCSVFAALAPSSRWTGSGEGRRGTSRTPAASVATRIGPVRSADSRAVGIRPCGARVPRRSTTGIDSVPRAVPQFRYALRQGERRLARRFAAPQRGMVRRNGRLSPRLALVLVNEHARWSMASRRPRAFRTRTVPTGAPRERSGWPIPTPC